MCKSARLLLHFAITNPHLPSDSGLNCQRLASGVAPGRLWMARHS